jgi:hypothetical protein
MLWLHLGGRSIADPRDAGCRRYPSSPKPPYTSSVSQDPELGRPNYSAGTAASSVARGQQPQDSGPRTRLEPRAVQALLAAVLSWFMLPGIAALVALQRARKARERIEDSQGTRTGGELVVWARILAYANLAVTVVLAFYWWRSGHLWAFGLNLVFS